MSGSKRGLILFPTLLIAALLLAATARPALAVIITIKPNEAASKDVFVYEGFAGINFNGTTGNPGFDAFATILGVSFTSTAHSAQSLIQFNLPVADADDLISARLYLFSSPFPFGAPVTAGTPMTVDAFVPDSAWDEDTVTWLSKPGTSGPAVGSQVFSSTGSYVSIDITAVTHDWLAGLLTNNGLILASGSPASTLGVAGPSSADANDEVWPYLELEFAEANSAPAMPEPGSAALVLAGVTLFAMRRRHGAEGR